MAVTTSTRLAVLPVYAVLPAEDLDRARMFYRDTLGLEIVDEERDGFYVRAGSGTRMLIYHSDMTHPAGYTVATWQVDDLAAVMADLRGHGIRFEEYDIPGLKTVNGVAEDEYGAAAWFRDSEGNIVNLTQPK